MLFDVRRGNDVLLAHVAVERDLFLALLVERIPARARG